MAIRFNPLTGNFDFTGSGGGGGSAFFAGEVATYADLPLDGTAALDSRWLVRSNSGTWPFSSYKQAGVYVRKAIVGASRDNDYQLTDTTFFDVMSDNKFLVFDNSDATKAMAFDVGTNVPTSSTVTLTVPAASGTIARTETFAAPPAIGNTTAAAANFTTVGATGIITGAATTASPPTTTTEARGLQFASLGGNFGSTAAVYGSHPSTASLGIGIANSSAGSITQVASFTSTGLNSCVIGGTTAAAGTFTALAANTSLTLNGTGAAELINAAAAAGPLRIYNTFTSATNHERGFLRWSSNTFTIGTEKGSGGGTARGLALQVDGADRLTINTNTTTGVGIASNLSISSSFGIGLRSGNFATATTRIHSDASDTIDLRRDGNGQQIRIYNTYASSTDFERARLRWASDEFILDAEKGGTGTLRGIKIGSATSSLLGFYGVTPVDQPATVADPAGGGTVDTEARTAINAIIDRLQELGLIA
jgi:hypothetical protein